VDVLFEISIFCISWLNEYLNTLGVSVKDSFGIWSFCVLVWSIPTLQYRFNQLPV